MEQSVTDQHRTRDGNVRAVAAFFAMTLLFAFGIGLLVSAASRGTIDTPLPESIVVLILVSPTLAAILLVALSTGGRGVRELLSRLLIWRIQIRWYLFAILFPFLLNLSSIGGVVLLGGSKPSIPGSPPPELAPLVTDTLAVTVALATLYFLTASLFEEIGWRGVALPLLQTRFSALTSSLVIGIVWAVWHVPSMFLIGGATQASIPFYWYLPSTMAISVLFTWLYNNGNGSLLLVTLLHAAVQAANILVPILPSQTGVTRTYALSVLLTIGVAAIIVLIFGAEDLSRSRSRIRAFDSNGRPAHGLDSAMKR